MSEGFKNNFEDAIHTGELVQLCEGVDLGSDRIKPDTTYKVLLIEHHNDEGGDAAWLGLPGMPTQDIMDFRPELSIGKQDERYKDVSVLAVRHLQRVTVN